MSELTKVTLNISEENMKALERVSKTYNMNKTTVINHAVALENQLRLLQENGGQVVLVKANGEKEIVTIR